MTVFQIGKTWYVEYYKTTPFPPRLNTISNIPYVVVTICSSKVHHPAKMSKSTFEKRTLTFLMYCEERRVRYSTIHLECYTGF